MRGGRENIHIDARVQRVKTGVSSTCVDALACV